MGLGIEPKMELPGGIVEPDAYGYAVADKTGATNAVKLFVAYDVRTK